MTLKDVVGGASAATLGFIMGDVPGAITGYKLYKSYRKNMPPYSREHVNKVIKRRIESRGGYSANPRHPGNIFTAANSEKRLIAKLKRNKALGRANSARRSVSKNASDRKLASRGSAVAMARRKRTINKFHHPKSQKKVKVSKEFKKKVVQVLADKIPKGYAQEIFSNYQIGPNTNAQYVDNIKGPTVDSLQGQYFTATQITNIASFLWAGKVYTNTVNFNGTVFNYENTKIHVKKQWVTVKYRNNSQRTYTIQIYASQRKNKQPAGAQSTMIQDWVNALSTDSTGGVNVNGSLTTTLYNTPFLCKQVMDNWKIEATKVVLAPGEEYVYSVEGPSKTYDLRKNWINGLYAAGDKDGIDLAHVLYTDLIMSNTGNVYGRINETGTGSGYAVVYETNTYYKIEMPDQTGITWATAPTGGQPTQALPVAGGTTQLGNRRDAYAIWLNGPSSNVTGASAVRVDRETPTTVAAN